VTPRPDPEITMSATPTSSCTELVRIEQPLFIDAEWLALAGFLAGYGGLRRP
jgi:hypothetical protein